MYVNVLIWYTVRQRCVRLDYDMSYSEHDEDIMYYCYCVLYICCMCVYVYGPCLLYTSDAADE